MAHFKNYTNKTKKNNNRVEQEEAKSQKVYVHNFTLTFNFVCFSPFICFQI